MVHKILFWAGFGIATRFVQLGIEMRPFFQRGALWVYPLFMGIGGSFGYWMQGVEQRQVMLLKQRKEIIVEKRRRRAEREQLEGGNGNGNGNGEGVQMAVESLKGAPAAGMS